MELFVAGGTGVIASVLTPMLVDAGHDVTDIARNAQDREALEGAGARRSPGPGHAHPRS